MIPTPDEGGFFGRARDLEQLAKLLEPEGALVTIIGPPGVGKTRLALELVRGASFDHLVCELGEVRTSDAMLERLAELLHVGEGLWSRAGDRERPLVRVGDALAEREGLVLVFDNVEQLIEVAAPALRALRQASPQTRWLVTSRMALGLVGEWRHEIAPLGVEPTDGGESDAARMLADRVTRARGSSPETEREILARIGARLDGLPLALELAASRIAAIGAVAVEARLDQQLELFTRGPGDLDRRPRTLRDAIAWSWDLLGANERRGLARLSVFRGGFDLAAAEAVVDAPDALDVVHALRDRSLLHAESGEARFGIYLSIRDFAAGELDDNHSAAAHERHARYYAALAERVPSALLVDRDNVFAAIERCVVRPSRDTFTLAARLLLGLAVLIDRSPLEPFLERLEAFLATTESVELLAPELRCELQITAGRCMRRLGRMRDAKRTYADALAIARLIRATEHEARLHGELGMVAYFESRLDDALGQWQTSIAMYAELGDDRRLGLEQTRCAMVLRESNRLDEARAVLEAALATQRRCDDVDGIVITLAELAQIHFELGELDLGTQLLAEAERFPKRSLLSETAVLARSAFAHWERGDHARGEVAAQRALVHLANIGYRRIEAGLHLYLAIARYLAGQARPMMELEWARRQLEGDRRAVHLCGAWLAYLTIADDREAARARFDALPALADGDPFAVVSAILRLALDPGPWDQRAAALGAAPLGTHGRSATASSIDVRLALRAVSASRAEAAASAGALLEVSPDGDSFTIDGTVYSLMRYRTLRRLLLRLVDMRLAAPTVALPWDQLFASGWPGERVHATSARNRVKVAISTLRSMGLRDAIAHDGNGYLLDPAIEVRVVRRD